MYGTHLSDVFRHQAVLMGKAYIWWFDYCLLSFETRSSSQKHFKIHFSLPCFFFFGNVFANEVNSHREQIIELDKTGTHLKYFSQKQDVVLIKNLLISVQSRWEKVVQRLVERGRSLDEARKRAKQVNLCKDPQNSAVTRLGY